jgi:hypothetical protein
MWLKEISLYAWFYGSDYFCLRVPEIDYVNGIFCVHKFRRHFYYSLMHQLHLRNGKDSCRRLSQYEVAQSGIGKDSCIFNLEKIINALPYVLLSICYCVIFILCTSL